MSIKSWPRPAQYEAAIQAPTKAFADKRLRTAVFETDRGLPVSLEGQRAVVFFADTGAGPIVVRCFKEPMPEAAKRYVAIRTFLAQSPVPALPSVEWIEGGIAVGGQRWPILLMDEAPGCKLMTYVQNNVSDPGRLTRLAVNWRRLMRELAQAGIAHGDLQQDNVLVTDGLQLSLVDLDAMWIPAVARMRRPAEQGHRNFQHPGQAGQRPWGRHMDTFPALVIYISLLAVAADPELLNEFNNEQNLIFSREDLLEPGQTALWWRLWSSPDLRLRSYVALLERSCQQASPPDTEMEALLSEAEAAEPKPFVSRVAELIAEDTAPVHGVAERRQWAATGPGQAVPPAARAVPPVTVPAVPGTGAPTAPVVPAVPPTIPPTTVLAPDRPTRPRRRAAVFATLAVVIALFALALLIAVATAH